MSCCCIHCQKVSSLTSKRSDNFFNFYNFYNLRKLSELFYFRTCSISFSFLSQYPPLFKALAMISFANLPDFSCLSTRETNDLCTPNHSASSFCTPCGTTTLKPLLFIYAGIFSIPCLFFLASPHAAGCVFDF